MVGSSLKNYGVIKMENNMKFLIYCCFCDKKLSKLKEFEKHIYDAHIYKIEQFQVHINAKDHMNLVPEQSISPIDFDFEDIIKVDSDNSVHEPELQYLEITTLSAKTDLMSSTESLSDNNGKEERLIVDKSDMIVENTMKEEKLETFEDEDQKLPQDEKIGAVETDVTLPKPELIKMDKELIETVRNEKFAEQIPIKIDYFNNDLYSDDEIEDNTKTNIKIVSKVVNRNYNFSSDLDTDDEIEQKIKRNVKNRIKVESENDNFSDESNSEDQIAKIKQTNENIVKKNDNFNFDSDSNDEIAENKLIEKNDRKVKNEDYNCSRDSHDESVENNKTSEYMKNNDDDEIDTDSDNQSVENNTTSERHVRKFPNKNRKIGDDSDSDDENLKLFLESLCTDSEEEIFDKVIDNYYCLKCNKVFKKLYNFEKHQQYHNIEYNCKECDMKCSTRKQLRSHLRCHTNIGPFICKICSKPFRTKNTLKNHNKIHIGNKPFSCDWCGDKRKFFYMREKLIHERTMHTKDYQYQCELCGRGFATQSFLSRHKRTHHTSERKFLCRVCNKAFTTHEGVYRHEKIHSSERPFHCEICQSKFISSSHLKRHVQVHIGMKPFKCELCDKHFARKLNLNDHLKTVHGKIFYNESITNFNNLS